jgi:acyl-[acyl-carrier-protein] desaturase
MLYVTMQELATRISHRNTGKLLEAHDRAGYDIMRRVAIDENHHFIFYRDIATAGFEIDPSLMMVALEPQVTDFAMPGTGIPDFAAHSKAIAAAGIYDFVLHYEQILVPVVLQHWNIAEIEGLDAEAEQARERILAYITKVARVAERMKAKREAAAAALAPA